MTTTRDELQLLYICYFGRPADPGGLSYWLAKGINQSAFSRMIYGQAEFQQTLLNKDIRAQVNSLYLNLFGRNGDSGGLDYWTSAIESGRLNIATLGVDLIYAARQLGNADAITLTAKLSAANAWTDRISENVTLKLNYQPESWLPWDSGAALLSGRSLLSGVTGTTTPLSSTKLDKSLVSVQARSGLPENLAASYSKLNGQAQSLIDPTTLSYYTASAGSVTFSTSEWARYSAKPNWNSSDLGYTHYYYLHSGGDSYSLSSTEQGIWQLLFSDLNSGPQHVLPIRFIPVSNAREATIVFYNNPVRSGNTLGDRSKPISSEGVVGGFWQTISTYRDAITDYLGANSASYGAFYRFIAMHELGHALGLDHPFENTLWPGFSSTDNPAITGPRPSETVMTYNYNLNTITSQYSITDQQALQYLWGTPTTPNLAFSETFQAVARQSTQDFSFQITANALPFAI